MLQNQKTLPSKRGPLALSRFLKGPGWLV